MLDDQMLWFLLIFSVPFVPAVVVFFMIKPQAGDARVGGSLPLFKDLKLELAGGIATYLVVVLVALIAYFMITRDNLIAFEVIPKGPDGQTLSFLDINPDHIQAPSINISANSPLKRRQINIKNDLKLSKTGPVRFTTSSRYRVNGGATIEKWQTPAFIRPQHPIGSIIAP